MTDFGRLERDRLHAPAPRPAGFLDLDDENFEENAMLLFIQEREAGVVHETDNFEDLIALRFPGFRQDHHAHQGGRRRGRAGVGRFRGNRGGHAEAPGNWGHEEALDHNDNEIENGEHEIENDNGPQEDHAWHEMNDVDEMGEPEGFRSEEIQDEFDSNLGPPVLNLDPDEMAVTDGQNFWVARAEGTFANDAELDNDSDDSIENPEAPTADQIHCEHNWDVAAPGNLCKACTLVCEEHAMLCTICSVEVCEECSQDFVGNALLNWPGARDVAGGDQDGEPALEPHADNW